MSTPEHRMGDGSLPRRVVGCSPADAGRPPWRRLRLACGHGLWWRPLGECADVPRVARCWACVVDSDACQPCG